MLPSSPTMCPLTSSHLTGPDILYVSLWGSIFVLHNRHLQLAGQPITWSRTIKSQPNEGPNEITAYPPYQRSDLEKNKKVMQCHAFTACRSIPNALCQVAVCGQSENIGARLHVPTPWIEAAFAVEFIRAVSYCWWHRLGRWAQTLPWVIRPTQLPGLCGFLQDAAHELSQW